MTSFVALKMRDGFLVRSHFCRGARRASASSGKGGRGSPRRDEEVDGKSTTSIVASGGGDAIVSAASRTRSREMCSIAAESRAFETVAGRPGAAAARRADEVDSTGDIAKSGSKIGGPAKLSVFTRGKARPRACQKLQGADMVGAQYFRFRTTKIALAAFVAPHETACLVLLRLPCRLRRDSQDTRSLPDVSFSVHAQVFQPSSERARRLRRRAWRAFARRLQARRRRRLGLGDVTSEIQDHWQGGQGQRGCERQAAKPRVTGEMYCVREP